MAELKRANVTLDEPFVLLAATNYFQKIGPLFLKTAKRVMLSSNNPTVHGSIWENMMSNENIQKGMDNLDIKKSK